MRDRSSRGTGPRDSGAAAVEFALLLPILLLLIFGMIDFGRALNAQITLTQAAREGVRLASIGQDQSEVQRSTSAAATGLTGVIVVVTSCPPGAGPDQEAVVTATYAYSLVTPIGAITGLFGNGGSSQVTLTGHAVMPCEY
jgi:Flp pilus assembly protein TadG